MAPYERRKIAVVANNSTAKQLQGQPACFDREHTSDHAAHSDEVQVCDGADHEVTATGRLHIHLHLDMEGLALTPTAAEALPTSISAELVKPAQAPETSPRPENSAKAADDFTSEHGFDYKPPVDDARIEASPLPDDQATAATSPSRAKSTVAALPGSARTGDADQPSTKTGHGKEKVTTGAKSSVRPAGTVRGQKTFGQVAEATPSRPTTAAASDPELSTATLHPAAPTVSIVPAGNEAIPDHTREYRDMLRQALVMLGQSLPDERKHVDRVLAEITVVRNMADLSTGHTVTFDGEWFTYNLDEHSEVRVNRARFLRKIKAVIERDSDTAMTDAPPA